MDPPLVGAIDHAALRCPVDEMMGQRRGCDKCCQAPDHGRQRRHAWHPSATPAITPQTSATTLPSTCGPIGSVRLRDASRSVIGSGRRGS
jgi:hypothetical protein